MTKVVLPCHTKSMVLGSVASWLQTCFGECCGDSDDAQPHASDAGDVFESRDKASAPPPRRSLEKHRLRQATTRAEEFLQRHRETLSAVEAQSLGQIIMHLLLGHSSDHLRRPGIAGLVRGPWDNTFTPPQERRRENLKKLGHSYGARIESVVASVVFAKKPIETSALKDAWRLAISQYANT